ncbi:DUF3703 domain-containing protein [Streptomyces sp. NBC_00539]|uniref:DUF3703 domain-containing protein n=1 Tax=Streptomyces sp. NBC_00539 TaxID=2975770 RepID=UPI002E8172F4|nr:DUF3703 domain-containing protein [Streptomyces sp. NBC_00539]WUC64716.1 DUF3703 domain-containing protein [Streptomyces sp. NBC_00539]
MTNLLRTCITACTPKAMPAAVRTAFEAELRRARDAPDTDTMWDALERAHIISQAWAWPHTRAHWHMFRLAVRCRDRAETVGQVVRILVAGAGSVTGRVPYGNTGRTAAGLRTPMPLPEDLLVLLGRAPARPADAQALGTVS